MRRREVIGLIGAATAWPLVARAQQSRKIPKVGVLWHAGNEKEEAIYLGALRKGLNDLGYVEGKNIELVNRFADEHYDRFDALTADLVEAKVDVIVASVGLAAVAAKRVTTTTPIVVAVSPDPVAQKLVDSLARPGGNVTGFSSMGADIIPKNLELLKDIFVNLSSAALLYNPNAAVVSPAVIEHAQAAAGSLQVTLHLIPARAPNDLEGAFSAITQDADDAVIIATDPMLNNERKRIAELALVKDLPTVASIGEMAQAGILISYGQDLPEFFRRTAAYVDKILKGAKPSDLPVEQPTKLKMVVNLKTARALRLTLPQSVLLRADEVIE